MTQMTVFFKIVFLGLYKMLYHILVALFILSSFMMQADTISPINAQETSTVNPYRTPLKNLSSFAILPIFALNNPTRMHLYETTYQILKTEFGKLGEVQELKMNNLTGLALAEAFLAINIEDITISGNKNVSITKTSLAIEAMTTIKKSNVDYLSYIWERSVFTEDASDKNIIAAVQKLAQQFTTCYQACNAKEPKKPTFYLYKS
jgi:hypothetical protein